MLSSRISLRSTEAKFQRQGLSLAIHSCGQDNQELSGALQGCQFIPFAVEVGVSEFLCNLTQTRAELRDLSHSSPNHFKRGKLEIVETGSHHFSLLPLNKASFDQTFSP